MPKRQNPIEEGLFCPVCGADRMYKETKTNLAMSGNTRYRCQKCQSRTTRPLDHEPQLLPKFNKSKAKRYIVTSAVNDTPVNQEQLATLERIAEETDARLIVIATVYKNPDMMKQGFLQSLSWPEGTLPYICQEKFQINKNLVLRGDARIRVTAINPLQGANHAGDVKSEIFGHPQIAMEMVPTPKDSIPKVLLTTGTISERNYGGSWTAKKAEFHHSHNALFIETRGDKFWPTQLPWDGEGIQLFDRYYTPNSSRKADKVAGVVYGDVHAYAQTKQERKILNELIHGLKAEHNVIHDILDFSTGSHHKEHDLLANLRDPDFDIRNELNHTCDWLSTVPNAIVVSSNHNDHLDQWFNRYNTRKADQNIKLYAELMHLANNSVCGLFEAYVNSQDVEAAFTCPNEEFDIAGIDVSQHGHKGPNGARGSGKGFARTGRKTIVGHSHTPGIYKGCWQVGTSAMTMKYAQGYSSWLMCHALISSKGKRSMIYVINGQVSPMLKEAISNNKFV
jgi:transposase-like protein